MAIYCHLSCVLLILLSNFIFSFSFQMCTKMPLGNFYIRLSHFYRISKTLNLVNALRAKNLIHATYAKNEMKDTERFNELFQGSSTQRFKTNINTRVCFQFYLQFCCPKHLVIVLSKIHEEHKKCSIGIGNVQNVYIYL